jgi:alanine racemase
VNVQLGDEVVLFGDPERGEPSVEDWAVAAGTISYEIITRIGPRVHREFINNSW